MKTKAPATIEDLYDVDGKAELVEGEIVAMSPTGRAPSRAGLRIAISLTEYEERTGLGRTYPDNTGFVVDLPGRKSFSPDVSFHLEDISPEVDMRFVNGAPEFAVEIRSETDYGPRAERKISAKISDYFAAGTQVVWDVDLRGENVVKVYRANEPTSPTIYRRGDAAEAEPVLPGWSMPVSDLFR
ncbi:MAG TPA: Uma2 family endonuclease [Chloroflexia bacterium]|jgi:Uma2 family endonuclease